MNEFKELHNELDKLIATITSQIHTLKELSKEIREERKLYPKPTKENPYPLIPPNPPAPYPNKEKLNEEIF